MTDPARDPDEALCAMASYLKPDVGGRHASLVEAELIALVRETSFFSQRMQRALFKLGHPGLLRLLLDVQENGRAGDLADPLALVPFASIRKEWRIPTLSLLLTHSHMAPEAAAGWIARAAIEANDPDLLAMVRETWPGIDLLPKILTRELVTTPDQRGIALVANIIAEADPSHPAILNFAARVMSFQHVRYAALLMKAKVRLKAPIEKARQTGKTWPNRLLARISSGHGELAILARLPDPPGILEMPEAELRELLAGPSSREAKRRESIARKAAQIANGAAVRAERARKRAASGGKRT